MVQLLWKAVWKCPIELNILLPYDPVIVLFDRYPWELESYMYTKT